jgi:hypothetical protein
MSVMGAKGTNERNNKETKRFGHRGLPWKCLLSFSRDCTKSGFAYHFEWQLQNVIAPSIYNGLP